MSYVRGGLRTQDAGNNAFHTESPVMDAGYAGWPRFILVLVSANLDFKGFEHFDRIFLY